MDDPKKQLRRGAIVALAAHSHLRKKLGHDINLVIWLNQ